MAFGFGVLRRSSATFWAMTPRELAAAIDGVHGVVPPRASITRSALDILMTAFPDQETT
jgi:uncharacterized phage protein (TIGR02216 family)